jgi:glycosyltransferase involved in cell wall biosynthesis
MGRGRSVTVIVPVHNGERFLGAALESVLSDRCEGLEVLVVDDGSTDASARLACSFGEPVTCVSRPNRGPSAARNLGLGMATGNVIAFLDSDDLWPAGTLTRRLEVLESHPEADLVQGRTRYFKTTGDAVGAPPAWLSEPDHSINLGAWVFRRSLADRVGPFDESMRFHEDTDWMIRAWESGARRASVDDVCLLYRRHGGNMTLERGESRIGLVKVFKRRADRRRAREGGGARGTGPRGGLADFLGWTEAPV